MERIKRVQYHLTDLRTRLSKLDQPARAMYDQSQSGLENRFARAWSELSEIERNTWRNSCKN